MSAPLLPDSRLHVVRGTITGTVQGVRMEWEPTYCANCGRAGPLVPTENMTFAFYLCDPCHEAHGAIAGTHAVPDEVFFAAVHAEQLEQYGRTLTPHELAEVVSDGNSTLAKLARDRK